MGTIRFSAISCNQWGQDAMNVSRAVVYMCFFDIKFFDNGAIALVK